VSTRIELETEIENITAVLGITNGLFLIYDTEGTLKYVNRQLRELLGYASDDVYRMNVTDLVIKRHKNRIREVLRTKLPEGQERVSQMPLRGRDGKELFVITRTAPIYKQERVVAEVVVIEDLTERKKTEDELRDSQRLTADIIQSLPDPTMIIDQEGRVLYWNREMVELTGYTAEAMVGKSDYEYGRAFYKGARRPLLVDMIIDADLDISHMYANIYRDGNVLVTDRIFAHLKGEDRIVWGRAAPLFNTRGDIVGAIESVRDITDRIKFEEDLIRSHTKLETIFAGTVEALAVMTEKRDQYTAGHQQRVASLAVAIAREMGMGEDTFGNINIAATLHDIGKLYVPLDILNQTGKLTDIEYLFIKTHPAAGYDILKSIPFDAPIAEIILQHHERMDGSGYPRGLCGDEILIEARIIAVADVVEAMVSHRPYRQAMGVDQALEEIRANAGRLYDSTVVEACVDLFHNHGFSFDG